MWPSGPIQGARVSFTGAPGWELNPAEGTFHSISLSLASESKVRGDSCVAFAAPFHWPLQAHVASIGHGLWRGRTGARVTARIALMSLSTFNRTLFQQNNAAGASATPPLRHLRAWLHVGSLLGALGHVNEWPNAAPHRGPDALVDTLQEFSSAPTLVNDEAAESDANAIRRHAPAVLGSPPRILRFTANAFGTVGSSLLLPLSLARTAARGWTLALLVRPATLPAHVDRLLSDPRDETWSVPLSSGKADVVTGRLEPSVSTDAPGADLLRGNWVLYVLIVAPLHGEREGSSGALYRDGLLVASPRNVTAFMQLRIGGGRGSFSSFDMLSLAIYDISIGENERASLEGELAWRFGLERTVLPNSHPYRYARPVETSGVLPHLTGASP